MSGPSLPRRVRRPPMLARIPRDGHAVIEASAGTGKTHLLERLVADEVLRGVPIDAILVLTFTEKATREMRARVRALLARLEALHPDDPDLDPPPGEDAWTLDAEAHARVRAALQGFDRAPIATIHAFCQRVLAEEPFASGRRFVERLVDARGAFHRAFREELRHALAPSDPLCEPLLELLSAGGVEALERDLHGWAQEPGRVEPDRSMDAWSAALAAVPGRAVVEGQIGPALARFHARGDRGPRGRAALGALAALRDALVAGEAPEAVRRRYDAWAAEELETARAALAPTPGRRGGPQRPAVLATVAGLLDAPSLAPRDPFAALVTGLLPRVRARLDRAKRAAGEMDFDDLVAAVAEAVEAPGSSLRARLRARYRVALIDEFQDTDARQWAVFRAVFFEAPGTHRLRLIGDPKQAIYGFRGADVHTYRQARDAVVAGGGAALALDRSWRSTPRFVEITRRLFETGLFTGGNRFTPVDAAHTEFVATDAEGRPAAPLVLLAPGGAGDEPIDADGLRALLAHAIAHEVAALLSPASPLRLRGGPRPRAGAAGFGAGDVQILTRTAAEGLEVGEALRALGVPFTFFRQEGLFDSPEALALLDLLAALERPDDRARRLRVWSGPFFDVPLAHLAALRDAGADHPLYERLLTWRRLADARDFTGLFQGVVRDGGLVERALAREGGDRALTNHLHLSELLVEEARAARLGLRELHRRLADLVEKRATPPGDEGDVQRLERDDAAVQVLTQHKAKGLEADVVFLFGGVHPRGPGPREPHPYRGADGARRVWLGDARPSWCREAAEREAREEDERLLYVAVTRARARLYVPYLGPVPARVAAEAPRVPRRPARRPTRGRAQAILDTRLEALLADGSTFEGPAPLAVLRVVDGTAVADVPAPSAEASANDPGAEAAARARAAGLVALREARRGFVVTSYSRWKAAAAAAEAPDAREAFVAAVDAPEAPVDDGLPGGTAFGLFLHEVLERADRAAARRAGGAVDWLALPAVRGLFEAAARRHGVEVDVIDRAAPLAFAALRAPLELGDGGPTLAWGIAGVEVAVPEMRFLYPLPALPGDGRPTDLVRGIVDLVFRHEGRTYFLDWKTDRLVDYGAPRLAAHVATSYALQADLYTAGVLRLLDVAEPAAYEARFGGLLYCFLRGMHPGDGRAGVHFARPSWAEVEAVERRLAAAGHGGGPR